MKLPDDPAILLSYLNTQLRDYYPSLDELCRTLNLDYDEIIQRMKRIDYSYHSEINQFR